jgi:hypothetical protein
MKNMKYEILCVLHVQYVFPSFRLFILMHRFPYMTVCKPGVCAELVYAYPLLQERSQSQRNFKTPRLLINKKL